jgi:hypothetical protein
MPPGGFHSILKKFLVLIYIQEEATNTAERTCARKGSHEKAESSVVSVLKFLIMFSLILCFVRGLIGTHLACWVLGHSLPALAWGPLLISACRGQGTGHGQVDTSAPEKVCCTPLPGPCA